MLEKMVCKECGGEINLDYITPAKSFRLDENGTLVRDDNNLTDKSSVEFVCSIDRCHNIGNEKELFIWMDAVEFEFYERGLYLDQKV